MSILFIRYAISLAFGILMTFAFGNISIKKNIKKIVTIYGIMFVIEVILLYLLGLKGLLTTYPLHTHLLLILFLHFLYKIELYNALIYVMMAYMCCQIPAWISKFTVYFSNGNVVTEILLYLLGVIITSHIIIVTVGDSIKQLLGHSWKSDIAFGILPITYYFFDYATTMWTELLYSGNYHAVQFIPFVLCIGYPAFAVTYRQEQRRRREAYEDKVLIEKNMELIENEIENFYEIERMTRIYRHDMRHHLTLILSFIQDNKLKQAEDYIHENIQVVTESVPERYCNIDVLNMLLSHYGKVASEKHIKYSFKVNLPETLPISNMEICALVSNALENACQGCLKVPEEKRDIELVFKSHNDMIIFLVDNSCQQDLKMEEIDSGNDWHKEHGLGTKSIEAIAKKFNGSVSFSAQNGLFSTMVVIKNS